MQSPGAQLQSCPINFSLTHFQHSQTPQHVPFLFLFPLPRPYTKQSDLLYLRVNKNTCTIAPGPTPSIQSTLSVLILHVPVKQILPILQDPFYCHFLPEAFSVPHNYLFDFSQHLYLFSIIALYYSYYIILFYMTVNYIMLLTLLNQLWGLSSNLCHQRSANTCYIGLNFNENSGTRRLSQLSCQKWLMIFRLWKLWFLKATEDTKVI